MTPILPIEPGTGVTDTFNGDDGTEIEFHRSHVNIPFNDSELFIYSEL